MAAAARGVCLTQTHRPAETLDRQMAALPLEVGGGGEDHRVTPAQNSPARSLAACRQRQVGERTAAERSNGPRKAALHSMSHCSKGRNLLHAGKTHFGLSGLLQFYQEKKMQQPAESFVGRLQRSKFTVALNSQVVLATLSLLSHYSVVQPKHVILPYS